MGDIVVIARETPTSLNMKKTNKNPKDVYPVLI